MLSVSIIIPILNEESCLEDTLFLLRQQQPCEIIVVSVGGVLPGRALKITWSPGVFVRFPVLFRTRL